MDARPKAGHDKVIVSGGEELRRLLGSGSALGASRLERDRFPAAAGARLIWILKGKARLELINHEVEPCAEQKHHVLWGDEDFHALVFDDFVAGPNVRRQIQRVRHSRATAVANANSQTRNRAPGGRNERAGARGGSFRQRYHGKVRIPHPALPTPLNGYRNHSKLRAVVKFM